MDKLPSFLLMPALFLLLQLAALVLALVYWKRCPQACALLFIASLLSMMSTAGGAALQFVHPEGKLPFLGFIPVLSILNWLAFGLMLLAIFVGRHEPTQPAWRDLPPDDDWQAPVKPAGSGKDATGIQAPG